MIGHYSAPRLDAVVAGVGDVDQARPPVHSHALRRAELPRLPPKCSIPPHVRQVRAQHLEVESRRAIRFNRDGGRRKRGVKRERERERERERREREG